MKRDNPTALYVQIADAVRQDIAAGRFEPTGRLPSEEEMRAARGVSRVTVRLALARLEEEGLVERRRGKGTFTSGKQVHHALDTLRSFHESLLLQGFDASIRLISAARLPEPDPSAAGEQSLCMRVERLHLADGEPIAVGISLLPSAVAGSDWGVAEMQPVYALLETVLGKPVRRAEFGVRVQDADPHIAGLLGVRTGRSLLVLDRSSHLADGTCVDRSTFFVRPERYRFTVSSSF